MISEGVNFEFAGTRGLPRRTAEGPATCSIVIPSGVHESGTTSPSPQLPRGRDNELWDQGKCRMEGEGKLAFRYEPLHAFASHPATPSTTLPRASDPYRISEFSFLQPVWPRCARPA